FFQAEDGIRDRNVTGVQTCALPIFADHLANVAGDVPNVKDATAVVAGPYAVVGIDVDKDLDRSRVGTIKYSVTEALQHDPYGKRSEERRVGKEIRYGRRPDA